MPFIKEIRREIIDNLFHKTSSLTEFIARLSEAGELDSAIAYIIYKILKQTYETGSWTVKAKPLKILSDIDKEYYERVLRPYADKKIKENGDI